MDDEGIRTEFGRMQYYQVRVFCHELSVFTQPLRHCAKGLASVGYIVLLFLRNVCKSLSGIFVSYKNRIVSESSVSGFFSCYDAFESSLEEMLTTIDYKGNGIAFLAPSGTGKSTHTGLWKKYYPDDVTVINDDSPAVKLVDDRLKMYGTPWSGKTSINANRCVDLNAIVFLRQAHENSIRRVENPIEALQVILPETYKPVFEELANYNMDMLDILIRNVPMYIMYCNISKEAVDMVKDNVID